MSLYFLCDNVKFVTPKRQALIYYIYWKIQQLYFVKKNQIPGLALIFQNVEALTVHRQWVLESYRLFPQISAKMAAIVRGNEKITTHTCTLQQLLNPSIWLSVSAFPIIELREHSKGFPFFNEMKGVLWLINEASLESNCSHHLFAPLFHTLWQKIVFIQYGFTFMYICLFYQVPRSNDLQLTTLIKKLKLCLIFMVIWA